MPGVIENHSKLSLEDPQIIKSETSERFGGVLGALGLMNAERRANKCEQRSQFDATWSICVPCWLPPDFEGPNRLVFLHIFGVTAKTRNNVYFVTTVPLTLENAKQQST